MAETGVCYYPEHWPQEMWASDAARMIQMGLSWVRIGEFAWSRIEPKPGEFAWDWLDHAIEVLSEAGLKIVMCTPTATPPRWMVEKYPKMLPVDADGNVRKFGSRRHYSFSHIGYREEAIRITKVLGERYGSHPAIQAWQIDNEYGCHDTTLSYGAVDLAAFRVWLGAKYATVEALNTAWGNIFWSMEYDRFDQIELPNQCVTEPNPAHAMDFRRFASDQVVVFNRVQVDALRAHTNTSLIHNYMGRITDFDHFAVGQDLDVASWDSYPLGFLEDRSDQSDAFKRDYARQGDPDFQAFHHDLYRAVGKGRWWVMEQQPGPVNWAPHNPKPAPGMVRLWSWEAAAHGAEVISYFRWRQAPFAQEQNHAGLNRPDNIMAVGGNEAKKFAEEIEKIGKIESKTANVALVFDYASQWAWEVQPQDVNFDYFRLVYDVYRGLRRLGLSVDILPPTTDDFSDRKLVLIPGLFAWTDDLRLALSKFKGQVVMGPRTGSRTSDFQIPDKLPPQLDGIKVIEIDTLRGDSSVELSGRGQVQIWREVMETDWRIDVTTTHENAVIVSRDSQTYWAAWPDDTAMSAWLGAACDKANVKTSAMPEGLRVRQMGDHLVLMNYGSASQNYDGHSVAPCDVKIIKTPH